MKKTYLVGALMIGASVIFVRPIKAQAVPVAGATYHMYVQNMRAPVAEWQQDILDTINEDEKPKKEKKNDTSNKRSRISESRNWRIRVNRNRHGEHLTRQSGIFDGPSGKETYYNLPMERVIQYMGALGFHYRYWIREDGVKMYGQYVMCAADLSIRPKGTIVETSLGQAIVCDTGTFVNQNRCQLDIATAW